MLRAPTGSEDARLVADGDTLRNEFEELRAVRGAGAPVTVEADGDSGAEPVADFEDAIAVEIVWAYQVAEVVRPGSSHPRIWMTLPPATV